LVAAELQDRRVSEGIRGGMLTPAVFTGNESLANLIEKNNQIAPFD
jgi:hypothetical protein